MCSTLHNAVSADLGRLAAVRGMTSIYVAAKWDCPPQGAAESLQPVQQPCAECLPHQWGTACVVPLPLDRCSWHLLALARLHLGGQIPAHTDMPTLSCSALHNAVSAGLGRLAAVRVMTSTHVAVSGVAHLRVLLKAFSLCSSPAQNACHMNGARPAWSPCPLAATCSICGLSLVPTLVARSLRMQCSSPSMSDTSPGAHCQC